MNIELLLAFLTFALISSITPGPNNLMLMASGANFGLKRTMPHYLGVISGFFLMITLVGIGLIKIFETYPLSYDVMRIGSIAYLSFLAWKIATAKPLSETEVGTPISCVQAVLFQWLNPKAWAMALTAVSVYAPSQGLADIAMVAIIFAAVNVPSVFIWVVMGQNFQRFLNTDSRLRVFNLGMALLLVVSLYPVFF